MRVHTAAPDPFQPVVGMKLGLTGARSLDDYNAQIRRRAEILAITRRMLARDGAEGFTLRSVSDASHVTTQTIHNSFGYKSDLLLTALNQHALMVDSHALAQVRGPAVFLALVLGYYHSAASWPEFMREHMRLTFSTRESLREELVRFGVGLKLQLLRGLQGENLLHPLMDPCIVADQIAWTITFNLWEWTESDDLNQLYARLIQGCGTILIGSLERQTARKLEPLLARLTSCSGHADKPRSIIDLMPPGENHPETMTLQ